MLLLYKQNKVFAHTMVLTR